MYFVYASNVWTNGWQYRMEGDVGLVNVAYDGTLVNSGTLAKTAGNGVSNISGLNFTNNGGRIDVQSGTLQFNGNLAFNDGTRFTGAGTVQVLGSATFSGRVDAANLVLGNATYTGGDGSSAGATSQATLHGSTRWTGGSLVGNWELGADHALTAEVGGTKYIGGSVINHGVVNASDNLYFVYASQVLGNRGTLNLQGDVGLLNAAYGGTVINSGVINKTTGSGETSLAGISLANTGTINVQSGTLRLPANFSNEGVLTGTGTLAATQIVNLGRIAPGASSGALSGTLTLASQLVLGATGALSGSFAQVTLVGFGSGAFDVVYDRLHSDVLLHITQDVSAVPEPEGYALWLSGLAGLGLWLRRRGHAVGCIKG